MNDHDRDLILSLAAGSLDDDAADEARSRIESDPELATALEKQLIARAHLSVIEPVAMTTDERQSMRRDLLTNLHLDARPAPPPRAKSRSLRWWQPVVGIAAAAVVVTAIVVVPGGLSGSDSAEDVALTTIPASGEVPEFSDESDGGTDTASGSSDEVPPATADVLTFDDVDGSELLSVTEGETDPQVMSESIEEQLEPKSRSSIDVDAVQQCLEALGTQIPEGDKVVLGEILGSEETDTGLLVFVGVIDPQTGIEAVVTIDVAECRVVDIDR